MIEGKLLTRTVFLAGFIAVVACQTTGVDRKSTDDVAAFAAWKEGSGTKLGEVRKNAGETFGYPVSIPANAPWIASDYLDRRNFPGSQRQSTGGIHRGIDIGAPVGYPVIAANDGTVTRARRTGGNPGNFVLIYHQIDQGNRPVTTAYAHLKNILVWEGQYVSRGDVIGTVGNTGRTDGYPHLHFEMKTQLRNEWVHVNLHDYWYDGPGQIPCFDKQRTYLRGNRTTYPLPCVD